MSNVSRHRLFRSGESPPRADKLNQLLDTVREADRLSWFRAKRHRDITYLCKIVPNGPRGEKDFCDARYWVRQIALYGTTGGDDCSAPGVVGPDNTYKYNAQFVNVDPIANMAFWGIAINLDEVVANTHTRPMDSVVLIREIHDEQYRPFFCFGPGGGGGTSQPMIEVRIAKAISNILDALGERELAMFIANGPHLKCYQIAADGTFVQEMYNGDWVEKYIPVKTNWLHPISDFKGVNWNAYGQNWPAFAVHVGVRGYTLAQFGEGQDWVTPPSAAAICDMQGPAPTGACCLANESCVVVTQASCATMMGNYLGDLSVCPPAGQCTPPAAGACCSSSPPGLVGGGCGDNGVPCCTIVEQGTCAAAGGTFQGAGTTCVGSPCMEFGVACCTDWDTCIVANDAASCFALMGQPKPVGIPCSQANCDTGQACCMPLETGGGCVDLSFSACTAAGGSPLGFGSDCAGLGDTCPVPDLPGACCGPMGQCQIITASACAAMSWNFNGMGTTCTPNPCPAGLHACCHGLGICTNTTSSQCFNLLGSYLGGTDCSNPAAQTYCDNTSSGACCHGSTCTTQSLNACTGSGGTFLGINTPCAPANPCFASYDDPPAEQKPPGFFGRMRSLFGI